MNERDRSVPALPPLASTLRTSLVPRPVREEQQITEALLKTVGPEDALRTTEALLGGWFT
jgi:hypothetical protein